MAPSKKSKKGDSKSSKSDKKSAKSAKKGAEKDKKIVEEKICMEKFPPGYYTVSMLVPGTEAEVVHEDLFVRVAAKRARRAVVILNRMDVIHRAPKPRQKELETNIPLMALQIQRRIYETLVENELILEYKSLQDKNAANYVNLHCPEEEESKKGGKASKKGKKESKKGGKESKKSSKGSKKESKSSKSSGKSSEKSADKTKQKATSKLAKRGEEFLSKKYIEDQPIDGPKIYIALCGYNDDELFQELLKLNLPMNSIVKSIQEPQPEVILDGSETDAEYFVKRKLSVNTISTSITAVETEPAKEKGSKAKKVKTAQKEQPTTVKKLTKPSQSIAEYWTNINDIRFDLDKSDHLKGTAFVDYAVPEFNIDIYDEAACERQGKILYDEISSLLYDIQDMSRQHTNYIDHMKMVSVDQMETQEGMDVYSECFPDIPNECFTVPIYLHCLLQTVHNAMTKVKEEELEQLLKNNSSIVGDMSDHDIKETENGSLNTEKKSLLPRLSKTSRRSICIEHVSDPSVVTRGGYEEETVQETKEIRMIREVIAKKIIELNEHYELQEFKQEYKSPYGGAETAPDVLTYGNTVQINTYDMENNELLGVTAHMLKHLSISRLYEHFPEVDHVDLIKYNYHMEQLRKFIDSEKLSEETVKRILHLLVFDKMSDVDVHSVEYIRQKWRRKGLCRAFFDNTSHSLPVLKRIASPMKIRAQSDFRISYEPGAEIFECPEIAYLADDLDDFNDDPKSELLRAMECFTYSEPMSPLVLMQTLLEAFDDFMDIDYEHYAPTDSVLIHFHNPKKLGKSLQHECHIDTAVCFRDFCDFVLEEHKEWFDQQEEIYEQKIEREQMLLLPGSVEESILSCIDAEFLTPGTLKYKSIHKEDGDGKEKGKGKGKKETGKGEKGKKEKGKKEKGKKEKGEKGKKDKDSKSKSPKSKSSKSETSISDSSISKSPKSKISKSKASSEEKSLTKAKGSKKGSKGKKLKAIKEDEEVVTKEEIPEEEKIFTGYNLGDIRRQLDVDESCFFATKTQISVKLASELYAEKILLMSISMNKHVLYYNIFMGKSYKRTATEFHLVCNNGIVMAFGKKKIPPEELLEGEILTDVEDKNGEKCIMKKKKSEILETVQEEGEPPRNMFKVTSGKRYPMEFNMKCSWPNGLQIETVECEFMPHYIRQTRAQPKIKETKSDTGSPQKTESGSVGSKARASVKRFSGASTTSGKVADKKSVLKKKASIIGGLKKKPSLVSTSIKSASEVSSEIPIVVPPKMECLKTLASFEPAVCIISYYTEAKRVFLRNGSVVIFNTDDSVNVQCSGGNMYYAAAVDVNLFANPTSSMFMLMEEYLVVQANGKQFTVTGGVVEEKDELMVSSALDFSCSEVYIRRIDGTNIFLTMDSLVTTFPNGTRITCSYAIEYESMHEGGEEETVPEEVVVQGEYRAKSEPSVFNEQRTKQAWLLVTLTCKFEHPNYATVEYNECLNSTLTMPDCVMITTYANGESELILDNISKMTIFKDFTNFICMVCNDFDYFVNANIYYPSEPELELPQIVLQCTDVSDKVFHVDDKGKCFWDKNSIRLTRENVKSHEWCRVPQPDEMNLYFILHRNLEGERLHSKSEAEEYRELQKQNCFTNCCEFSSSEGKTECLQVIEPLDKTLETRWTMPYLPILPTSLKAKHLCVEPPVLWRGPYSVNPKDPVKKRSIPEILEKVIPVAVVIRHFCLLPDIAPKLMRQALASYRKWALQQSASWNALSAPPLPRDMLAERVEQKLADATVGAITALMEAYAAVKEKEKKELEMSERITTPRDPSEWLKEALKRQAFEHQKEIVYKKALREHIIPPYFQVLDAGGDYAAVYLYNEKKSRKCKSEQYDYEDQYIQMAEE